MKSLGHFDSTAYGPPWNAINGSGTTAGGTDLRPDKQAYIVAVDPDVIPLGTRLFIWPNPFQHRGAFLADDKGGAINGNRIDFYDWRGRTAQYGWGRRDVQVWKAEPGDSGVSGDIGPQGGVQASPDSGGAESGLVSGEQRSGLLKALLWVVLVLGGAAVLLLGTTRVVKGQG